MSVRRKRWAALVGGVALLGAAMAGCGVGKGAPDGWTYVNAHGIAFAIPKDWRLTPAADLPSHVVAAAVLRRHGTRVADVEVLTAVPPRPRGRRLKARTEPPFTVDGVSSTEVSYAFLAGPSGLPRRVTDVTTKTARGQRVVVRIRALGKGAGSWVDTMERIANSIQVGTIGRGNILQA